MRILVVGATGTIGRAVVRALGSGHEILQAARHASLPVDTTVPDSIRSMFAAAGPIDAIIAVAGDAAFRPLAELTDADMEFSLRSKLMGQVNLVRYGLETVRDHGCITLTSGVLSRQPMPGGAAFSLVNAAVEAFGRAAALEAPRGIRINVVCPGWVTDTLVKLGMDPAIGSPPDQVAALYVKSLTGGQTGAVMEIE